MAVEKFFNRPGNSVCFALLLCASSFCLTHAQNYQAFGQIPNFFFSIDTFSNPQVPTIPKPNPTLLRVEENGPKEPQQQPQQQQQQRVQPQQQQQQRLQLQRVQLFEEEEPNISFPEYNQQSEIINNNRQFVLQQQQQQQSPAAMQFAWNMMKTIVLPKQENTVICPILPQTLLATLHDAADNVAKAELRSSVFASSRELGKLVRNQIIATQQSGVNKLDQAMAIFLGDNTKISLPIEKNAREDGVEILPVNFQNRNAAAATANNWVAQKSQGAIREIVSPSAIDPATRMLMASVIYFKGKWKHQFTKTEPGRFETSESTDNTRTPTGKQVPMMYQYNKLRYGEKEFPDGNGMRWVELPYEGSAGLSMVLMLPKVRHQLQRSADQLTMADMVELIASLKQNRGTNKMHLHVPKFNIFSSLSLVPALKSLGLRSIFDRVSALKDLSSEQLVVRDVSQRTFISIDEQGTKAVSVASLSFVALSAAPPLPTINFTVNEPFLLMIVDKTYEYPLFVGKIVNPETN